MRSANAGLAPAHPEIGIEKSGYAGLSGVDSADADGSMPPYRSSTVRSHTALLANV
jgi:hypothetical protein